MLAEEPETRLDQPEDRSFTSDYNDGFPAKLRQLRRELLEARHTPASQRDVVTLTAKSGCDYVNTDLKTGFSEVRDHSAQVVEPMERPPELLKGARDHHHAPTADREADTTTNGGSLPNRLSRKGIVRWTA
jgi:Mg2+ and Co2+ transporter CorA